MNQFTRRTFLQSSAVSAAAMSMSPLVYAQSGTMSHRERIEAASAGKPTDRLPFGFWWHFPNQDRSPRRLAELTLQLQKTMDTDFIKYGPFGLYSVVDWGTVLNVRGGDQTPIVAEYGVKEPEDWYKLKVIPPTEGEYAVVLAGQRICVAERPGDIPLVQTIFSPMISAAKLAGADVVIKHMNEHPEALMAGLEVIAETTRQFAVECVRQGADGLFFASDWSNVDSTNDEQFEKFVRPTDMHVLDAVKDDTWFNILHIHRNARWKELESYPVQSVNFPDYGDNSMTFDQYREISDKALVSGIAAVVRGIGALEYGNIDSVRALVDHAWQDGNRRGVILAPDEVVSLNSKPELVAELAAAVQATAG